MRWVVTAGAVAIVIALGVWWWLKPAPRATARMTQDVYVWQRQWGDAVDTAVANRTTLFNRVVVLAWQITWGQPGEAPSTFHVEPNWQALRNENVGLAVRIGSYRGKFDDASASHVAHAVETVVKHARANGISPVEVQLDFDAGEKQLDGYRVWLAAARQRVDVPVVITALPSWLSARGFKNLASQAPGYVLQVHSLERPATRDDRVVLCDAAAAQVAVERAARLGVPFRVALPTYGYVLIFDNAGKYAGLQAEGPQKPWPAGHTKRWLGADAGELAALMRSWEANRPAAMTGVIWYRLPVDRDRYNWRPPTLQAVMKGEKPAPNVRVHVAHRANGLREIVLENAGNDDARGVVTIDVNWPRDAESSSDALGGFEKRTVTARGLILTGLAEADDRLAPGEQRVIGWLRLEPDMEVAAHVQAKH